MSLEFNPADVELHSELDQLNRQNNALKLNVDSVDFETCSGIINGYDVSLEKCTCVDFLRRQKPCKHMYRLAHELGIFQLSGKVVNEPNAKISKGAESYFEGMHEREKLNRKIKKLSPKSKKILCQCAFENKKFFLKIKFPRPEQVSNLIFQNKNFPK